MCNIMVSLMKLPAVLLPLLFLAGCNWTPKDAYVFEIDSTHEYDRAELQFPQNYGEGRPPLRLKWVDTNTFMTTATLESQRYYLTGRTNLGGYFSGGVNVSPEVRRYKVADRGPSEGQKAVGPTISGELIAPPGQQPPRDVVVVLTGLDVTVRRVQVENGRWEVEAPAAGNYRISLQVPGDKPQSVHYPTTNIAGNTVLPAGELK